MTEVIAYNEFDGIHRWEGCPAGNWHEYLKYEHRHRFIVETFIGVMHDDRNIEFFAMQDQIKKFVESVYAKRGSLIDFAGDSCETIARKICENFNAQKCIVREDGKGGAVYVRD